jgi:branched-subunit amino acid transport protein
MSVESEWYVYLAICLLMVSVVATRASYWIFGHHIPLPDRVRLALKYAPAAGLVAIIVPEILPWTTSAGPVLDFRLAAALVAIVLFKLTRSAVVVIVGGTLALWLLRTWVA